VNVLKLCQECRPHTYYNAQDVVFYKQPLEQHGLSYLIAHMVYTRKEFISLQVCESVKPFFEISRE
jgi:hypothetical protein